VRAFGSCSSFVRSRGCRAERALDALNALWQDTRVGRMLIVTSVCPDGVSYRTGTGGQMVRRGARGADTPHVCTPPKSPAGHRGTTRYGPRAPRIPHGMGGIPHNRPQGSLGMSERAWASPIMGEWIEAMADPIPSWEGTPLNLNELRLFNLA
jgi:hypothetical protein